MEGRSVWEKNLKTDGENKLKGVCCPKVRPIICDSCRGKLFPTPLALWLFKLEIVLLESAIAPALLEKNHMAVADGQQTTLWNTPRRRGGRGRLIIHSDILQSLPWPVTDSYRSPNAQTRQMWSIFVWSPVILVGMTKFIMPLMQDLVANMILLLQSCANFPSCREEQQTRLPSLQKSFVIETDCRLNGKSQAIN